MLPAGIAHELLRKLVQEVLRSEDSGTPPAPAKESEVLLDDRIDGVRYILIRPCTEEPARSSLSPREEEIARMVARGFPNKVIADVLEISPWTVCTHLRRIFAKLDVRSRAAMVSEVIESGWSAGHPFPEKRVRGEAKAEGGATRASARVGKR